MDNNLSTNMAENHNCSPKLCHTANSTTVIPIELEEKKSNVPRCHDETHVYKALYSLHRSLLLGGLVFKKNFSKHGIKRHLTLSHLYSYIVLILIIMNTLRWSTMFQSDEKFGVLLFMRIIGAVWGVECLAHYMSFVVASESNERLHEFFWECEKMRPNFARNLTSFSRLSNTCAAILWILVFFHVGTFAYYIFFTDLQNMTLAPWDEKFEYAFIIRSINTIQQCYFGISWAASSALMFTICKILAYEFKQVNYSVKTLSTTNPGKLAIDFEAIRQTHQNLCNLVSNADGILSTQIAIGFSGSMLLACLMTYVFIYDDSGYQNEGILYIMELFWTIAPIGKVIMDCVSGAILNGAVRAGVSIVPAKFNPA